MYFRLATTYFCCVVFFVLVQTASGDPGSAVFFCRLLSLKFAFLSLNDLLDCPGILINLWSQNRYGQELYIYYSFLIIDQQLSKETLDVVLITFILGVHYECTKKKRKKSWANALVTRPVIRARWMSAHFAPFLRNRLRAHRGCCTHPLGFSLRLSSGQ